MIFWGKIARRRRLRLPNTVDPGPPHLPGVPLHYCGGPVAYQGPVPYGVGGGRVGGYRLARCPARSCSRRVAFVFPPFSFLFRPEPPLVNGGLLPSRPLPRPSPLGRAGEGPRPRPKNKKKITIKGKIDLIEFNSPVVPPHPQGGGM